MISLSQIAKENELTRIGINFTSFTGRYRYLCEVWAVDVKFCSATGSTQRAAINRAVAEVRKRRKVLASAKGEA